MPNFHMKKHAIDFLFGYMKIKKTIVKIGIWEKFKISFMSRVFVCKVEIFLEQREVAFLSPSKICKNLNFSNVHL